MIQSSQIFVKLQGFWVRPTWLDPMVPINPACTGANGGGSYMCFSKCAEEQAMIAFMMGTLW